MDIFENSYHETDRSGSIEVICGSMFSGKTEELIRRVRRAKIAHQKIEIFKPSIDVRYSDTDVVSHNKLAQPAVAVDNSYSILLMSQGLDVVAIDEAQFFDQGIVDVCNKLANQGVRVIVAGHGLSRQSFWPDAATLGHLRFHLQDTRHLRALRTSCQLFIPHRQRRAASDARRDA